MSMLPEPLEVLDLTDGQSVTLRIVKWTLGRTIIRPRREPAAPPRTIQALRLFLPPGVKVTEPQYWDLTSKTLIAGLLPYLQAPGWEAKEYHITKHGVAPTARFTLEVRQPGVPS